MEYSFENTITKDRNNPNHSVSLHLDENDSEFKFLSYIGANSTQLRSSMDPSLAESSQQPNIYIVENMFSKNNIYISSDPADLKKKAKISLVEQLKSRLSSGRTSLPNKTMKIKLPMNLALDHRKRSPETSKISSNIDSKRAASRRRTPSSDVKGILSRIGSLAQSKERRSGGLDAPKPPGHVKPRASNKEISLLIDRSKLRTEESKKQDRVDRMKNLIQNFRRGVVTGNSSSKFRENSLPNALEADSKKRLPRKDFSLNSNRDRLSENKDIFGAKPLVKPKLMPPRIASLQQIPRSNLSVEKPIKSKIDSLMDLSRDAKSRSYESRVSGSGLDKIFSLIRIQHKK